jgi:hypothetical protein
MFRLVWCRAHRVARWRRRLAMLAILLVLGVVLLDAHAALPDHHHVHGVETMCLASVAIATLAVAALAFARPVGGCMLPRRSRLSVRRPRSPLLSACHSVAARDGPPVVLRR